MKSVPRSALCFAAELSVPGEQQAGSDGATLFPFDMLARTAGVAYHPFWGRCIHDFAGMIQPKAAVSIDYCHNPADVIGFADRIVVQDNALRMGGNLVSLQAGDRASEVARKRKAGVPYETSITTNLEGLEVEFVPDGYIAEVNGMSIPGPITIFRRWEIWGVAALPYGADSGTAINFGAGDTGTVSVPVLTKGAPVSTQTVPPTRTGQDYLTTFGDRGGRWFAEGKPFEECFTLFAADLQADSQAKDAKMTELSAKITELTAQLDEAKTEYAAELQAKEEAHKTEMEALKANFAGQMGGSPVATPPSGGGQQPPAEFKTTFTGLTEQQAKFANAIKLPGQQKQE